MPFRLPCIDAEQKSLVPGSLCPAESSTCRSLATDGLLASNSASGSGGIANRIVGPRLACTRCEAICQAPLPSRPIERGRPGAGLLAHVLVAKYGDHLPLYRQSQIFERKGIDLDRSTLSDWVGKPTALLEPSLSNPLFGGAGANCRTC